MNLIRWVRWTRYLYL